MNTTKKDYENWFTYPKQFKVSARKPMKQTNGNVAWTYTGAYVIAYSLDRALSAYVGKYPEHRIEAILIEGSGDRVIVVDDPMAAEVAERLEGA